MPLLHTHSTVQLSARRVAEAATANIAVESVAVERVLAAVAASGGMAATNELYRRGIGRESIRSALDAGVIWRVRKGWYASSGTPLDLVRAARVGGRATCVTAAAHWKLWMKDPPDGLHVSVAPDATQLRSPRNSAIRLRDHECVLHWTDPDHPTDRGIDRLLVPPELALRSIVACLDLEAAFVIVESALSSGLVSRAALQRLTRDLPAAQRLALASATTLSGSGLESLASFRLRRAGIPFRQQVQIGPDRVDLLIGNRLIVELDGSGFHDQDAGNIRDARTSIRGYRSLHFRYRMVMNAWPEVEASIHASIARGDHL